MTAARSSARADAEHARQQATDHATITAACQELTALWPQLAGALDRDSSSSGANAMGGGGDDTRSLVNHDVAEAITEIRRWTSLAAAECQRILGRGFGFQTIPGIIELIPGWHHRLQQLNLPTAGYLLTDALHAQHAARRALHLTEPNRPLPAHCPQHPDTKTRLVKVGQEVVLDAAILEGRIPAGTFTIQTGAYTRTKGLTVRCPRCGMTWAGPNALMLAKIIEETP